MKLDPFYLIVPDTRWIERLVPVGIKLVQLRLKDMEKEALRFSIRRAKRICAEQQCQLIINDHWQLAIEEGCDFIHLGQEDLAAADLAAIKKADMKLGISTHDHVELETALAADPDYLALGPIYPTILKKMKWAPQGLERLREWSEKIGDRPLVAIGGLNPERLSGVFDNGANSAAVVTDITLNPDPEARAREWVAATDPWR
ncbi:thiamine phosphate synthase [Chelativorans sp. YIM 93263]|uniref:thiamine phosphate synthase n=1 Tax=Chelativorans sp. YIM 93263 TaxID=2906648 RepID=UPI002379CD85|nr:thiamine phosphate synthase [Chelativorans sp. YIM 93263]